MGINDRDYMRDGVEITPKPPKKKISLWKRIRFKIWLLLHPNRKKG